MSSAIHHFGMDNPPIELVLFRLLIDMTVILLTIPLFQFTLQHPRLAQERIISLRSVTPHNESSHKPL